MSPEKFSTLGASKTTVVEASIVKDIATPFNGANVTTLLTTESTSHLCGFPLVSLNTAYIPALTPAASANLKIAPLVVPVFVVNIVCQLSTTMYLTWLYSTFTSSIKSYFIASELNLPGPCTNQYNLSVLPSAIAPTHLQSAGKEVEFINLVLPSIVCTVPTSAPSDVDT